MFFYLLAGLACLLALYNPLSHLCLSRGEPARLPRTPRPRINESLLALDGPGEPAPICPPDAYSVHILSKAPLVVYIENFISEDERAHLLEISEPLFEPSTITNDGASTRQDALVRDSEVALLPRTETVRCIEQRALGFQGWRDDLWLERLRTQRYGARQHYSHHFDWGSGARGWGRASSVMAWVAASDDLEGGGTAFPRLQRSGPDDPWCRWVECAGPTEVDCDHGFENGVWKKDGEPLMGVTFRPVAGNVVFWENFRPDGTGRGWDETWHAGLPVTRGTKVGLNIWSWGRLS
ncbi:Uu.00g058420.m01.CDS01 [Anthostomella pinea]|uniref:Uu.00g058420.m01.CDS01 n=1 Tax=Anthostomella pinea TaxID=933095 RepID=A0AAI8VT18_9PEZI|nr:Uu.00g058420.m01.CDS01 [Anthostomella pinea]